MTGPAADSPVLQVGDTAAWRTWLADNHDRERQVWLVIPHRDSERPGPGYGAAIEQALCFGWIDSHARKHSPDAMRLRFSPRRQRSNWSAVNRRRAAAMIERGQMTPAGTAAIELAKTKGTWEPTE